TTQRLWAGTNAHEDAKYYVQAQTFSSVGGTVTLSAPSVEFFDKLGRSVRKLGVNGDGRAVASDTAYDNMGRAYRSSVPFYVEEAPVGWNETTSFDLLGRPLAVR